MALVRRMQRGKVITMAQRTKTDYQAALTKYFKDFDRLKERLGRPPTAKEMGPLPTPNTEDIEDAGNFRFLIDVPNWRGASEIKTPTSYKVRY